MRIDFLDQMVAMSRSRGKALGAVIIVAVFVILIAGIEKATPHTAINTLATLISNIIIACSAVATRTGLPSPLKAHLLVGLWVFFGVLGLVMLFGSLEESVA